MTFQSINKINGSAPPNITAHSAGVPCSEIAFAVAFRYTRLAVLLIDAVLPSQGKCACIPLVRSVLLSPHHATGGEGVGREQRPVPCSCALIPST